MKNLFNILLALATAIIICLLMPQTKNTFLYHFELGKPWAYELLTAEESFPIYKTEKQLQQEKETLKLQFNPYYNLSQEVTNTQLSQIQEITQTERMSDKTAQYLNQQMTYIYNKGIISIQDLDKLTKDGYKTITVLDQNRVAHTYKVTTLFTPKSAYTYLIQNAPTQARENRLKELDLQPHFLPNLIYDEETSQTVLLSLMQSVSLTQGVVQAGEKIIDRGEIINEQSYQILASLRESYNDKNATIEQQRITLLTRTLLVFILIALLTFYLIQFRPAILQHKRNTIFLAALMLLMIIITTLLLRFTNLSTWFIPFAWTPILVRIFFDSRTGFFTHLITVLLCALIVPNPFIFTFVQLLVGTICVGTLKDISNRSSLAQTALWVFLTYVIAYTALQLMTTANIHSINPLIYAIFFSNAILVLLVYGLVFITEKTFGFISATTLIELTNVNSPLLRKLAQEAPGTFQHSLQVSNLASDAAQAINANPLLVRAGALYHDIGKINNAFYFTENQTNQQNPLLNMTPTNAAQIVINHVKDGVEIAKKYKLPEQIIQFIQSHHGTSITRYFYNTYQNQHPEINADTQPFQYHGPIPNTKETTILMMADAVEARSKSLQLYNEQTITDMVNDMINTQIQDQQLINSPLTLQDIQTIKQVFIQRLLQINHHRIQYPKLNKS